MRLYLIIGLLFTLLYLISGTFESKLKDFLTGDDITAQQKFTFSKFKEIVITVALIIMVLIWPVILFSTVKNRIFK